MMKTFRITSNGLYPAPNLAGGLEKDPHDPSAKEVDIARKWIRAHATPRKRIERKISSYGLKHHVEDWTAANGERAYVSNGAFIAAAVLEGYRYVQAGEGSPNAFFNMSVPSRGGVR
jgi:hypothetical protein